MLNIIVIVSLFLFNNFIHKIITDNIYITEITNYR